MPPEGLRCVELSWSLLQKKAVAPQQPQRPEDGQEVLQWLQAVLYVWLRVLNRLADSAPHNSGVRGEAEICAASKQVAHTANWKALAIGYASCT